MIFINRMATIPYIMITVMSLFLILPIGSYNLYSLYNSYIDVLYSMENDFEEYLSWSIKKERATMDEFFSYRRGKAQEDLQKKLHTTLTNAHELLEILYKELPEKQVESVLSRSTFPLPVYIISDKRQIIAHTKSLLNHHIQYINRSPNQPETLSIYDIQGFTENSSSPLKEFLIVEKKLASKSCRIGVLISTSEIKKNLRRDVSAFFSNRDNSGIHNFILSPDGTYIHNESFLFPGRRIASKDQQEKATSITQNFLNSINDKDTDIIQFTWNVPDMPIVTPQIKSAFARYEPYLGWVVGVAIDIEEFHNYYFENEVYLDKQLYKIIINMIIGFIFLICSMIAMGYFITQKSLNGFRVFQVFFQKASKSNNLIRKEELHFKEFRDLADVANIMVKNKQQQRDIILAYMKKLRASNQKLKKMANKDGLTGIANRRFFDSALDKSWHDALRHNQPVTVGMIDIDFFKQYNDTYGHQKGDQCLITFAECMEDALKRPYDMVARYGGEEFITLFPHTDTEGAMEIAYRIHEAVSGLNIPHETSSVSPRVTFSMGIATLTPSRESTSDLLVQMADTALYKAKNQGRNQIVVYK